MNLEKGCVCGPEDFMLYRAVDSGVSCLYQTLWKVTAHNLSFPATLKGVEG